MKKILLLIYDVYKIKKTHTICTCLDIQSWRRKRDLNPRTLLHVYELSKPTPSASWVFLHIAEYLRLLNYYNKKIIKCTKM